MTAMARLSRGRGLRRKPQRRHAPRLWIFARIAAGRSARAGGAPGRVPQMRHHDEAIDLTLEIGVQEGGVILEGHASVRLTVGAQHVGMRQDAVAAVHAVAPDRIEPYRPNLVEELSAQCEII